MALGGRPGVHSARYANVDDASRDFANNEKLLNEMKDIPKAKRLARFCSVIAIVFPNGKELISKGYINGEIGFKRRGQNGFGYDPLFYIENLDRTMAELTSEEKNKISHRANALKAMKLKLEG